MKTPINLPAYAEAAPRRQVTLVFETVIPTILFVGFETKTSQKLFRTPCFYPAQWRDESHVLGVYLRTLLKNVFSYRHFFYGCWYLKIDNGLRVRTLKSKPFVVGVVKAAKYTVYQGCIAVAIILIGRIIFY